MTVRRFSIQMMIGFAALVLGLTAARADVFSAAGIAVDASADSAQAAREIAHAQGRRQAFETVIKRLTRAEDWQSLPPVTRSELQNMGSGLRILDERRSQNRYLATISYAFQPTAVRDYLRGLGVPFSESQARTAVVLPVLEADGARFLWEQPNPWLDAWSKRRLVHELTPVEVPLGDLEDIGTVDAEGALRAHWPDLAPLAQRYGQGDALVTYAALQRDRNDPRLAKLSVSAWRVDEEGRMRHDVTVFGPITAPANAPQTETVFDKGVTALMALMAGEWKTLTLVDYASRYELEATVTFASLTDWAQMRAAIDGLATVTEWRAAAMTSAGAELKVTFAGSVDQLALNLEQRGFVLAGDQGYWEILRSGFTERNLEDTFGQRPPIFRVGASGEQDPFAAGLGTPPSGSVSDFNTIDPTLQPNQGLSTGERVPSEEDGYEFGTTPPTWDQQ